MNDQPAAPPTAHEQELQQLFQQAQGAVRQVFEQLQQRTADLVSANTHLQGEIAQHLELESRLIHAHETAQAATRLKDKFVSMVAHDLKSPLGAMLGLLEFVADPASPPLHPEQREMLGLAMNSGHHMLEIIKNLLDISRLQSGKITVSPTFLDGRTLVEENIARLSPTAERKGVALQNQVVPHTRLWADRHLLSEVVQNLLSNAIKFSKPGQTVTLGSTVDHVRGEVAIHVQDLGVGIEAKRLPTLFILEEKTTTKGTAGEEGTGFGLPFARDIMLAHRGDLVVHSSPAGSRFTFSLPLVKPRVLLVDDLRTARLMFRSILEPLDVDILEAGDGQEALEIIRQTTPHVVISDINMPRMDGFEMLAQLKSDSTLTHLDVVMVTTDEQIETRERAFALGAEDFVTKPIILCDFIPRIRRLVA